MAFVFIIPDKNKCDMIPTKKETEYVDGQLDLIKYLRYEAKKIMEKAEDKQDINVLLDLYNLIQNSKPISK